jgi:cell wall-associated NlpC family hydrolase
VQLIVRRESRSARVPRNVVTDVNAMRLRTIPLAVIAALGLWPAAGFAAAGGTSALSIEPPVLDGGALYPESASPAAPTGTTAPTTTTAPTGTTGATGATGTAGPAPLSAALMQTVSGATAVILPDGYAAAPALAPSTVRQAIWAANQLIGLPYIYGGGHASFIAPGYDCSGTVSYALHAAGLLTAPLDSSDLETWGSAGEGAWITVYTNPTHAFVDIAGIRLDTSAAGDPGGLSGPRWRPLLDSSTGYVARYAVGY